MKPLQWIIAFLYIMTAAIAASSFTANLTEDKTTIFQDEIAYVTVTITNQEAASDLFSFTTPEFDWFLDVDNEVGELAPGQTSRFVITLTPKPDVQPGSQIVRIKARSANTDEFQTLDTLITVRSVNGSGRQYVPSIFLSAQVPEQVDPIEPLTLGVYLRNRNARNYDKLDVRLASDLFTKEYVTSLGGIGAQGEKTNQLTIPLDQYTPPGAYPLTVTISVDNQSVNEYKTTLNIQARPGSQVLKNSSTSWFKTITVYSVTNTGNVQDTDAVLHPSSLLSRLFTSASADYTAVKSDTGYNLVFPINLPPRQSTQLTVTENYRLLFILIILLVLSIVSYFFFRSPIVLRKEAVIVGGKDGVSEMKMRLFVKNRSSSTVNGLHVIDRVTSMADVVKETSLGTLQPSKVVTKKGHGTLVRWDIDQLEAFEERIITYRVKTQLRLVGDVYLPAAKAKFDAKGKERTSYSNEVNIPREA